MSSTTGVDLFLSIAAFFGSPEIDAQFDSQ